MAQPRHARPKRGTAAGQPPGSTGGNVANPRHTHPVPERTHIRNPACKHCSKHELEEQGMSQEREEERGGDDEDEGRDTETTRKSVSHVAARFKAMNDYMSCVTDFWTALERSPRRLLHNRGARDQLQAGSHNAIIGFARATAMRLFITNVAPSTARPGPPLEMCATKHQHIAPCQWIREKATGRNQARREQQMSCAPHEDARASAGRTTKNGIPKYGRAVTK